MLVDHVIYYYNAFIFNSASAMEVSSLAQELQSNINSTNAIQQQVSDSLTVLEDSIQETQERIEQVRTLPALVLD